MTMHLERGLTTLNTKRKKTKRKRDAYYITGWREQNKFWKKHKLPEMKLSEYIDYVHGSWKPPVTHRSVVSMVSTTVSKTVSEGSSPSTSAKKLPPPKMGNGKKINWKEQQERLEVSKQYSIVPAYNKGPCMVVSRADLKTAGKKV